jgi:hypothetical protein
MPAVFVPVDFRFAVQRQCGWGTGIQTCRDQRHGFVAGIVMHPDAAGVKSRRADNGGVSAASSDIARREFLADQGLPQSKGNGCRVKSIKNHLCNHTAEQNECFHHLC